METHYSISITILSKNLKGSNSVLDTRPFSEKFKNVLE